MTTTAGHSFYIEPIVFFYNQVKDTGSWEPLVGIFSFAGHVARSYAVLSVTSGFKVFFIIGGTS